MNWIDEGAIEQTLRVEASGIASALGHRMTSFIAHPSQSNVFMSRCVVCYESMTITVRKLRATPVKGVAVQLRCKLPAK
jgi:hypothetical protein